jgi:hypothetical protein
MRSLKLIIKGDSQKKMAKLVLDVNFMILAYFELDFFHIP